MIYFKKKIIIFHQLVLSYWIVGQILKIETDLAHAGLNSDHVKFNRSNRPYPRASAPEVTFNPTSRSQSLLLIRTLKKDYAVIPEVFLSFTQTQWILHLRICIDCKEKLCLFSCRPNQPTKLTLRIRIPPESKVVVKIYRVFSSNKSIFGFLQKKQIQNSVGDSRDLMGSFIPVIN